MLLLVFFGLIEVSLRLGAVNSKIATPQPAKARLNVQNEPPDKGHAILRSRDAKAYGSRIARRSYRWPEA
jgi:hypothetical protein